MLTTKQKNRIVCTLLATMLTVSAVGCSSVSLGDKTDDRVTSPPAQNADELLDKENTLPPHDDTMPVLTVSLDELYSTMEQIEEQVDNGGEFPADIYKINVQGLSTAVVLTMQSDAVTAIEAYGQRLELKQGIDIYGNCSFSLFEADGAIIIEGGYYHIGDVYVLTPEKCSELHPREEASYWLWLDDETLKYGLIHNSIADIIQTGPLSVATSYDEFLYAFGNAAIVNGEIVFAEPHESYTMSDKYDMDQQFEAMYADRYGSIEEVFDANN